MTWPTTRYVSKPRLTKQMQEAAKLLLVGKSIARTAEIVGVASGTVERWRRSHALYREYAASLETERRESMVKMGADEAHEDFESGQQQRGVMGQIQALAPRVVQMLTAMLDSDNERTQLAAGKMILDVSGFVPPARRQAPPPPGPLLGADRLRAFMAAESGKEGRDGSRQLTMADYAKEGAGGPPGYGDNVERKDAPSEGCDE